MCGIVGLYNPTTPIDPQLLTRMLVALRHRGPDAQGSQLTWEGRIGLANSRLSLVDPTARANQPMAQAGMLLTFNGEIYNFRALRRTLEASGYAFTTTSDTEVLLTAYRHWGRTCLQHFTGCFAFILYDEPSATLLVARDAVGEKPLLYTRAANGDWLFASEIKALLQHPGVSRRPNLDRVLGDMLFGMYGDQDATHFAGIAYVPAGHFLVFNLHQPNQAPQMHNYAALTPLTPQSYDEADLSALAQQYQALLTDSIRWQLLADAPVGALLSGGLDSSLMTALAAPLHFHRTQTNLPCFSIKYSRSRTLDLSYARTLCGTMEHVTLHEVSPPSTPTLDQLRQLTQILDAPALDPIYLSVLANYQAAQALGLKAVLNGQGNDELWLGYYQLDDFYRYSPEEYTEDNLSWYWYQTCPFSDYFTPAAQAQAHAVVRQNLHTHFLPYDQPDKLHALVWYSLHTHLQSILIDEDKLSMANSVEVRLPYLDLALLQLALSVPSRLKVLDKREKYVVRQAATGLLPPSIIQRRKRGFPSPPAPYYRHLLSLVEPAMLGQSTLLQTFFTPKALAEMAVTLPLQERYFLLSLALFEQEYLT